MAGILESNLNCRTGDNDVDVSKNNDGTIGLVNVKIKKEDNVEVEVEKNTDDSRTGDNNVDVSKNNDGTDGLLEVKLEKNDDGLLVKVSNKNDVIQRC
jgi:hypothetical protein